MIVRLAGRASRAVYALFALLSLAVCGVSVRSIILHEPNVAVIVLLFAAAILLVVFVCAELIRRHSRKSEISHTRGRRLAAGLTGRAWLLPLVLSVFCFAFKLTVVLVFRVEPQGDYKTFYIVAQDLASGGAMSMHRYVALFPHIFGYSAFLSLFFRVFGDGYMVAPIVNAALSAVSALLLFTIAKRLFSVRAAVFAAVCWILFPSQTLFNIHALSEPLYTAELLLSAVLFLRLRDRLCKGRGMTVPVFTHSAAIGAVLWLVGTARPIAVIPIIATAIILLFLDLSYKNLTSRLSAIAVLCAVYFALGAAGNAYIAYRLGEAPATTPGYSIAVGFNEASGGLWNADDSNLLMQYSNSMSAEETQREMLGVAKERIFSGEIDFVRLMYRKLASLYSHDDTPVTSWGKETFAPHNTMFAIICNGFYLAMMALAFLFGAGRFMRCGTNSEHWFSLYFIGLTAAQMLVEVAFRYHYSAIIVLCVAGAGAFELVCAGRQDAPQSEDGGASCSGHG